MLAEMADFSFAEKKKKEKEKEKKGKKVKGIFFSLKGFLYICIYTHIYIYIVEGDVGTRATY